MKHYLLLGALGALMTVGCQSESSSATDAPDESEPSSGQNMMQNNTGMMAQNEQMAQRATAPGADAPAGAGSPRAQAMRLHDAAMNRMDALTTERQRLAVALAKRDAATPAGQQQAARMRRAGLALQQADQQMMAWMHGLHEPDSTKQGRSQVDAYWQQQLPVLQQLDQRITAALDSAKVLR